MTENFHELADMASLAVGGTVLHASDDFFAEKENLIRPAPPTFREHEYTDRGKWMDGWESRRRRAVGDSVMDEAIVRLGLAGVPRGVVVDTSFFRGNFPESCAIDGCFARADANVESLLGDGADWVSLVPRTKLEGDAQNAFAIASEMHVTHVRLRIFPDGGVARLRVHGYPTPDWRRLGGAKGVLDLAALESGGKVVSCSDMFFGPKDNLISPGTASSMKDGWETKRRRGVTSETHDWVVVSLSGQGIIERLEVDTSHFKGNFPDTCSVEGADGGGPWSGLLPRTKLMAHTRHVFVEELENKGPFTQVRLKVFPDGGVSRMRVFGSLTESAQMDAVARHLKGLSDRALTDQLRACCAARAWVMAIARARPFGTGAELVAKVDDVWRSLPREAWLEAFAAHPRIGEARPSNSREVRWSAAEQAGVRRHGSTGTLSALSIANAQYEEKFGYVFLICATGKTAAEMLHAARTRMQSSPEAELNVAAEELRKIVHIRLRKLIGA